MNSQALTRSILVVTSELSRIASNPAYQAARNDSPKAVTLIHRPWFIACMCVVCVALIVAEVAKVAP